MRKLKKRREAQNSKIHYYRIAIFHTILTSVYVTCLASNFPSQSTKASISLRCALRDASLSAICKTPIRRYDKGNYVQRPKCEECVRDLIRRTRCYQDITQANIKKTQLMKIQIKMLEQIIVII